MKLNFTVNGDTIHGTASIRSQYGEASAFVDAQRFDGQWHYSAGATGYDGVQSAETCTLRESDPIATIGYLHVVLTANLQHARMQRPAPQLAQVRP